MSAIERMLPGRLRTGLRAWRAAWTDLRVACTSPQAPPVTSRHTPAELRALRDATRRERAALVARLAAAPVTDARLRADFRTLEVREVRRETPDAVTLVLDNPPDHPIAHRPGQFLTLLLDLDGQETRRAYSLCSDPAHDDHVALTIKRVPGGRVSNHLNDHARPGDRLRTLGPSGHFGLTPRPGAARRLVLIGGGSGITPLMSIASAITRAEPDSHVTLVRGDRRADDVIFAHALTALAAARPNLTLIQALEEAPPPDHPVAHLGRLDAAGLAACVPTDPEADYFICGPSPMMDAAVAFLDAAGVAPERVHLERFVVEERRARTPSVGAVHTVRFARSGRMLQVSDARTLLEAARAAGLALPFSCTMGGCGACKQTIIKGEVDMDEPSCLSEAERAAGGCLTCIARPRSALVLDA